MRGQLRWGRRLVPLWRTSCMNRGMEKQQLPLLHLSYHSSGGSVASQHLFLPISATSAPQPHWWPGLTLLLKCPFLRNFCDPRLPILGSLHLWAGGEWSQPPAPLCLLGLYNPRMFQESTIKIRAVLSHNVFDSCSVTTWEDCMLIKLNCFSIKRNIYLDPARTADLQDWFPDASSLRQPSFSCQVVASFFCQCLFCCVILGGRQDECVSPHTSPQQPPGSPPVCSDLSTPLLWLLSFYLSSCPHGLPSLRAVLWVFSLSEPALDLSWQFCKGKLWWARHLFPIMLFPHPQAFECVYDQLCFD